MRTQVNRCAPLPACSMATFSIPPDTRGGAGGGGSCRGINRSNALPEAGPPATLGRGQLEDLP